MKRILLLTVAMLACASLAFAQGGTIGVFADNAGTNCSLTATAFSTAAFIVHFNSTVKGVQFKAPEPMCFTGWTLLSAGVNSSAVPVGDFRNGLAMGFANCQASPLLCVSLTYYDIAGGGQGGGSATACCEWPVLASAESGLIEIVDCSDALVYGTGQSGIFASSDLCPCGISPTENSTWGKVKSLYSE